MTLSEKEPVGSSGESPVSFGAGDVFDDSVEKELSTFDPAQMVKLEEAVAVSR